jgi:hypothetical protein
MKLLLLFLIASVATALADPLAGEITVAKDSDTSIRLPAVKVRVFKAEAFDPILEQRRAESAEAIGYLTREKQETEAALAAAKAAKPATAEKELKALEEKVAGLGDFLRYAKGAEWLLRELADPVAVTTTNSNGRFNLEMAPGNYVVTAIGEWRAGETVDRYSWAVPVTVTDEGKPIALNSGNLLIPAEIGADAGAMTGRDRTWLLKFVREEQKKIDARRDAERKAREAERKASLEKELQAARRKPDSAKKRAVELYPQLGVAGSPLNQEFVARVERYKQSRPDYFKDTAWPIALADECAQALARGSK